MLRIKKKVLIGIEAHETQKNIMLQQIIVSEKLSWRTN